MVFRSSASRARAGRRRFQELGLAGIVVVLGALLTLAAESVPAGGRTVNNFLRLDNILPNVATPMSWMAIMAIGATLVIVAGGIDISVGSIFGLAALAAAAVLQQFDPGAPAWQTVPCALAVAVAIGGGCGLVNGLLVVGLRVHPFIVTLGTLSIFRGIALVAVPLKTLPDLERTLPPSFTGGFMGLRIDIGAASGTFVQPVPLLILLLCAVWGWWYLARTVGGREIYAVGGNEEAARVAGLPVARVKARVFVLSGVLCGIAGWVSTGYYASANTATGQGYELDVIAAAAVGGASFAGGSGTALGAVLGALVIQLIQNGIDIVRSVDLGIFTLTLSKDHEKIVIGLAILAAVGADRLARKRP